MLKFEWIVFCTLRLLRKVINQEEFGMLLTIPEDRSGILRSTPVSSPPSLIYLPLFCHEIPTLKPSTSSVLEMHDSSKMETGPPDSVMIVLDTDQDISWFKNVRWSAVIYTKSTTHTTVNKYHNPLCTKVSEYLGQQGSCVDWI